MHNVHMPFITVQFLTKHCSWTKFLFTSENRHQQFPVRLRAFYKKKKKNWLNLVEKILLFR